MRRYHEAGDKVLVLEGPEEGQVLVVRSVRKYATDNGYYLHGGSGLYSPRQVELSEKRTGGNPCGKSCEKRVHDLVGDCEHCMGKCFCDILNRKEEKNVNHEKTNYLALSPQQKLQVMEAMGFREGSPLEHGVDCVSRQGSGLICTCWPGTTSFKAPGDVRRYMGETNEDRREFAEKRAEYENDGIGENPGSWVDHLAKTAPRYNS